MTKYKIQLEINHIDHFTVILTNGKGDTFTFSPQDQNGEELGDFLHGATRLDSFKGEGACDCINPRKSCADNSICKKCKKKFPSPQPEGVSEDELTLDEWESLIRLFAVGYVPGIGYTKEKAKIQGLCRKAAKFVLSKLSHPTASAISEVKIDKLWDKYSNWNDLAQADLMKTHKFKAAIKELNQR